MSETEFELPEANCLRCKGKWNPRSENPLRCIYCGSKYWNVPLEELPDWYQVRLKNKAKKLRKAKSEKKLERAASPTGG